jgi:hypothetical protein
VIGSGLLATKVAATFLAAFMVMLQFVATPVQSPVHPVKAPPGAAVAVSVIRAPDARLAEQLVPP